MGPTANVMFKILASLIAKKYDKIYSKTSTKSNILTVTLSDYVHNKRKIRQPLASTDEMDLATHEGPGYSTVNPGIELGFNLCLSV